MPSRIFHELIWTLLQGAGREAVVNLPRASCNTAEAFKVTRPKGEFFRHKIMHKSLKPLTTVCIFGKHPKFILNN